MTFNSRRLILSTLAASALLSAGAAFAQEAMRIPAPPRGGDCPCKAITAINIVKNSNPSPDASDFLPQYASVAAVPYNDSGADHYFRDTLRWKIDRPQGSACQLQGTVEWTVVNNSKNSLQNNDTSWAMNNGQGIPNMGGPVGQLAPGQTKTFGPYALTPAQILSGKFSVGLQDDSAMKEIRLRISGCCMQGNI